MDLMPIVAILEAANVGVRGQSIFIAAMPVTCKKGILFRDNAAGSKIDWNLPGYYKTSFTGIARAQTYEDCNSLILAASQALTINVDFQVPNSYLIRRILPMNLPNIYPLSDGVYFESSVRYEIVVNT